MQPRVPAMLEKLQELERAIGERRIEMLFVREYIPLAVVISEHIRMFSGKLVVGGSPSVGALLVARPLGILINRALGDLLTNVVKHGGDRVDIYWTVTAAKVAVVEVIDDGPGFDPAVLEESSKSLHLLRSDARRLGGDLTMQVTDDGTCLRLMVPLR